MGKFSYFKIFHLEEIENSKLLQFLFYCITLSFLVTFYGWVEQASISTSTYIAGLNICPPYFLDCGKYYFLNALPYGYTQSFFYVILFLILGYGVVSAIKDDWVTAHKVILITFTWKCIWGFLLTYGITGNFDYYDMTLAFVWLFLSNKEYFAKLSFVWLYFLASSIKIHDGWILGNYFNTLFTGAPFLNKFWTPVFTNLVIFMQMVGIWFIFSKNKFLQRAVYIYFFLFHIYSGIIVNYRYIIISIPALYVLFSQYYEFKFKTINRNTVAGYLFLFFLVACQFIAILIPGDQKKTLEGNYYGMYMFEANHQCISNANISFNDPNKNYSINSENSMANNRCDPYNYFYRLKTLCHKNPDLQKISWTFDHSINGHPFERIVDTQNVCDLEYKSFGHNDWIKTDGEAQVLDLPVYKNGFGRELSENIKIPSEPIINNAILSEMIFIYWIVWYSILFSFILFLIYITFKKQK